MYSMTVFTTIGKGSGRTFPQQTYGPFPKMTDLAGYGNLTPSTDLGKVVTMLYALLGIPLMFIYMANIGTVLASSFKFLYSKVCRCEARPDLPGSATLPAMCREDTISLRQEIN